jgi:hypothetical protein
MFGFSSSGRWSSRANDPLANLRLALVGGAFGRAAHRRGLRTV